MDISCVCVCLFVSSDDVKASVMRVNLKKEEENFCAYSQDMPRQRLEGWMGEEEGGEGSDWRH